MESIFGNYCIAASIKADSSSSTYYARLSTDTRWNFVVKMLPGCTVQAQQDQEGLLAVLDVLFQLKYPHVLPMIDYGIEKDMPYFVTEYMSRGSLRDLLDRAFPMRLPVPKALKIFGQVAQAVSYAHEHGLLHGNIKPQNILLSDANDALLADFCLPWERNRSAEGQDEMLSAYYPPEEVLSEKSDQYALGCLAYELLTGQLPAIYAKASSLMLQTLEESMTDTSSEISIGCLEQIEIILLKAMAEEPQERYESVAALLQAIDELEMPLYTTAATLSVSEPDILSFNGMEETKEIAKIDPVGPQTSQAQAYQRKQALSALLLSLLLRLRAWPRRQELSGVLLSLLSQVRDERKRRRALRVLLVLGMLGIVIWGSSLLLFLSPQQVGRVSSLPENMAVTVTPQVTTAVLSRRVLMATSTSIVSYATSANSSPEAASGVQKTSSHSKKKSKSSSSSQQSGNSSSSSGSQQQSGGSSQQQSGGVSQQQNGGSPQQQSGGASQHLGGGGGGAGFH